MALSALRSVSDAIEVTRAFLFPPSIGRWAALTLLAALMGSPGTPVPANPQFLDPSLWRGPQPVPTDATPDSGSAQALPFDPVAPATWPTWLVAAIVAVVLLVLAYQVVGVLARFVVASSLAADEVRLRSQARAALGPTARVVAARVAVVAIAGSIALALLLAAAPFGPVALEGGAAGAAAGLAALVAGVAWIVDAATLQFVVPTMLVTDDGVVAAWRRFGAVVRANVLEYAAFAALRTAVGVGVGIGAAIGIVVVLALGGVVVVTLAAGVVAIAGGLGGVGALSFAALAILAVAFVAYAVAAAAAVAVPFQIYLWSYALLVLGDTDAELDLIPDLRAAVRSEGGARVEAW